MNYIWTALGLLIILMFISLLFLLIYNGFHNWYLERHWKDGKYSGIPFPSIYVILAILLIIFLFGAVVVTSNRTLKNRNISSDDSFQIYECNSNEMERQYSKIYVDAIKEKTLPGYQKYEKKKGSFLITSYVSTEEYDTLHPSLLVFVEYKGERDYKFYTSRIKLDFGNGEKQESGQAILKSEYYCTIINGAMQRLKGVDIEVAVYENSSLQEKDYEDEVYRHAIEVEKLKIEEKNDEKN